MSKPVADITGVVLTSGEPSTEASIRSVERQTLALADIIVVRNRSPFHAALNYGAAQVRTPFFVQVDADVLLEPECLAALRPRMEHGIGLVSGFLRDPVVVRTQGVRLRSPPSGSSHWHTASSGGVTPVSSFRTTVPPTSSCSRHSSLRTRSWTMHASTQPTGSPGTIRSCLS